MSNGDQTDEILMMNYQKGIKGAFSTLFSRYVNSIEGIMRRQVWSNEDVSELVQQTFLQLHRARNDYQPARPFKPWIITIALNLRRQYMRRKSRKKEVLIDVAELESQAVPPREIEKLIAAQRLRQGLSKLKEKPRHIIEMHWFEGLTFEEISQSINMKVSATKVAAHRAYKQLQSLITVGEQR